LKTSPEEEEIEEATEIVSREVRRRKEADVAALEKALQLAKEIEIPVGILAKESTIEAAQLGLELTKNLQHMVVADELLKTVDDVQEEAGCSEVVASKSHNGNTETHY